MQEKWESYLPIQLPTASHAENTYFTPLADECSEEETSQIKKNYGKTGELREKEGEILFEEYLAELEITEADCIEAVRYSTVRHVLATRSS